MLELPLPSIQYSLAGEQGMVSSNTIIASLSHNTPKSVFGQTFEF